MLYAIAHGVLKVFAYISYRNLRGDCLFRCGREPLWNARGIVCNVQAYVPGTEEGSLRDDCMEPFVGTSLR